MHTATPERRLATEEISGLIERVTFHNDESGFCVLRVKARGPAGRDYRRRVSALRDRWGVAVKR